MADFFEIDFLEVHTKKSGDAIALRYEVEGQTSVHVVDGGYAATGDRLVQHINEHFGSPTHIHNVVVTHPDQDHAEGLQAVLNYFSVGALWMLQPWKYAGEIISRFDRYKNVENLKKSLREAYPYLVALEDIALSNGIPIYEPFQGATIGAFTVLAPSRSRYLDMVVTSAKTPQHAAEDSLLLKVERLFVEAARVANGLIRAAWGEENFPSDGTSNENEMSVVQFARLCDQTIVLTADAGRDGLLEAAQYAPQVGLILPGGVDRFQVPHHGGRHNVSTELLDTWFGKRLAHPPAVGSETFTAIVSAARDDADHPKNVVVRGLKHRGAKVASTDHAQGTIQTSCNAPYRPGWGPVAMLDYPDDMEE